MSKKNNFKKHYQYIYKQLDKKGKVYINTIATFIDTLITILEDNGIDEKKFREILLKNNKKEL